MSLSEELKQRGFIHQTSNEDLGLIFDGEKRVVYHGIDPSADSAHAGNFVNWMLLKHLANNGHKIVFLVGGATGMVGDPKPDSERQLKPEEEVLANVEKLKTQAEKFFEGTEVEFVNNYDWFKDMGLLEFLRDVGKHYTVNDLIKKEAIANRLQSDNGLSYTEFAYPLIQGYDFYKLNKTHNCTLQVGGSDQWGNMLSGVELVRRKSQQEVFVTTLPLIVDKSTGKKFGKSEGNAVWIDPDKTSPYKFYQFWLNTSDDSVVEHLKMFTLMDLDEISNVENQHNEDPASRVAQKRLAKEVTSLVHGDVDAGSAEAVSKVLFGGEAIDVSEEQKQMLLTTAPSSSIGDNRNIVDVLVEINLAQSKREAKTFIEGGAVVCGLSKVESSDFEITNEIFNSGILIIRRGKKNLHILTN